MCGKHVAAVGGQLFAERTRLSVVLSRATLLFLTGVYDFEADTSGGRAASATTPCLQNLQLSRSACWARCGASRLSGIFESSRFGSMGRIACKPLCFRHAAAELRKATVEDPVPLLSSKLIRKALEPMEQHQHALQVMDLSGPDVPRDEAALTHPWLALRL